MIINLDMQHLLDEFSGPDHWNDPDMLEIGNGVLTLEESKSHFSLWSMLAAPLMAGNDLRNMDRETSRILTNREVIEVNQDALGISARKVVDEGEFEVFVKPLSHGDLSVCLFNREDHAVEIQFDWPSAGITGEYRIRDLWDHADKGSTSDELNITIPAHGVHHVRLIPQ